MMFVLVLKLAVLAAYLYVDVDGCNEAVCGSVVTKCLLTKSCSCNLQARKCSKDCFNCLGYLYSECCSCVDMCPQKTHKDKTPLSTNSNVKDFIEAVPELFNVLTEYPDELKRWDETVFPIDIDVSQYSSKLDKKLHINASEKKVVASKPNIITFNCAVVFWSHCMSWTKCENNCLSMGSSSYRWFHDGCCECIGQHCLNYGLNKSSCRLCPLTGDADDIEDTDKEDYDYGEDEFEDYEESDV